MPPIAPARAHPQVAVGLDQVDQHADEHRLHGEERRHKRRAGEHLRRRRAVEGIDGARQRRLLRAHREPAAQHAAGRAATFSGDDDAGSSGRSEGASAFPSFRPSRRIGQPQRKKRREMKEGGVGAIFAATSAGFAAAHMTAAWKRTTREALPQRRVAAVLVTAKRRKMFQDFPSLRRPVAANTGGNVDLFFCQAGPVLPRLAGPARAVRPARDAGAGGRRWRHAVREVQGAVGTECASFAAKEAAKKASSKKAVADADAAPSTKKPKKGSRRRCAAQPRAVAARQGAVGAGADARGDGGGDELRLGAAAEQPALADRDSAGVLRQLVVRRRRRRRHPAGGRRVVHADAVARLGLRRRDAAGEGGRDASSSATRR